MPLQKQTAQQGRAMSIKQQRFYTYLIGSFSGKLEKRAVNGSHRTAFFSKNKGWSPKERGAGLISQWGAFPFFPA